MAFNTTQEIIEDIRQGKMVILMDDEDRENEGDLIMAAEHVTPEAIKEIADRELPGFGEVMRMESMKITKNAILSRNMAAAVGNALVICLPGKPKGAVECLGFVEGAIPHCVEVVAGVPTSC